MLLSRARAIECCLAIGSLLLKDIWDFADSFFVHCSMETITLGDKRIGIKTSVLEEKATACNMLCCYADELKEGFFPWIDQVGHDASYMDFLLLGFLS